MNVYQSLRGGTWLNQQWNARTSYRHRSGPSFRFELNGCRCALIVWRPWQSAKINRGRHQ